MTVTPSRIVAAAAIGWFVVYNAMRFAGGAAAEIWQVSLLVGGALGVLGLALVVIAAGRSPGFARLFEERPAPAGPRALTDADRSLLATTGVVIGALAALAAFMGVLLAATYLSGRADWTVTTLILAGWYLIVAVWLGDEFTQLRRHDGDGLDAIGVGCVVTAALAALGVSRDIAAIGQIALILLAGAAGFAAGYASWRLARRHRLPLGGIAVALAALVALALAVLA